MGTEAGEWIVRGSVWLALLCYPAGPLGAFLAGRAEQLARLVWSLGCLAFLAHAVSSFHVFYDWSHQVAVSETARQVAELTGRQIGAGVYLNYLFTLVWLLDAAWWWVNPTGYQQRSRVGVLLVHGFFLFMIFNATVVFETGAVRILGLAVSTLGAIAVWKALRRTRGER